MKDFSVKQDGVAGETGQVNASDINSLMIECENAVIRSGQTLNVANNEQLSEAYGVYGGAMQSFVDSGTANTIVLTPSTGLNGLKVPLDYARFNGFRVIFYAANSNTGNVTINIGQATGSLLGSKKLLQSNGSEIPAGTLLLSGQVEAIYNPAANGGTGAWILDEALVNKVLTGSIFGWALNTVPAGYLSCSGQSLSRTTYSSLFNVIGTTYGNVDVNTFNLPDYRGKFLRGWANGSANDPDRLSRTDRGDATAGDNVGTNQSFALEQMTGIFGWDGSLGGFEGITATGVFTPGTGTINSISNAGDPGTRLNFDSALDSQSSTETRPININVNYIIKF